MRFSRSAKSLAVVSVMLALLLTLPAMAVAAGSPPPAPQGKTREQVHKVQSHVNTDPVAPGDPRPEIYKKMAQTVPEEYLPEELKPKKKITAPIAPEGNSGAGTGGWYGLSNIYDTVKDPSLSYSLEDTVTDNSGRVHFLYSIGQYSTFNIAPGPAVTERLYDLYYRSYNNSVWSQPVKLTNHSNIQSNTEAFFDVDDGGCLHVVFNRYDWAWSAIYGNYEPTNENFYYRYLRPGSDWSAASTLTGFSGRNTVVGSSFRMENNKVECAFTVDFDRQVPYPGSHRSEVYYLSGAFGDWNLVGLDAWDWSITQGSKTAFNPPSLDIANAGSEVAVAWSYMLLGPGGGFPGGAGGVESRATVNGRWEAVRQISGPVADSITTVAVAFRPLTDQAGCLYMTIGLGNDQAHSPHGNLFVAYKLRSGWKSYNLSTTTGTDAAAPSFVSVNPNGLMDVQYLVNKYVWNGTAWRQTDSSLMYRGEAAPQSWAPASPVAPFKAGRQVQTASTVTDPDGAIHTIFIQGKDDTTSQAVYYAVKPAGKYAFETPVMLRDLTPNLFDFMIVSALPGGRVLATWMEYRIQGGVQTAGAIYSRMKVNGQWTPAKLVSTSTGNRLVRMQTTGYGYYFELGRDSDTGEQQAVFETADLVNGNYVNIRKYWSQTTNGSWSEPELVFRGSAPGLFPGIDSDLNGRSMLFFEGIDPQTGQNVDAFTEQKSATPPATTYFAEGTTRNGFDEWLSVQNANYTKTKVNITYMLENGDTPTQQFEVAPRSRYTVDVRAAVGEGHDVSAAVTADQTIAVERPMYFDYNGWTGGSVALGVIAPSRRWYFAEGSTRENFQEYLTLQNPSDRDTVVTVTFMTGDGKSQDQPVGVGKHSRVTRDVNKDVGPGKDVSIVVDSPSVAVVAERPMYFNYKGWTGGDDVVGSTRLGRRWYFAEGTTRHNDTDGQFDTYMCVQNPTTADADVSFRFLLSDGTTKVQGLKVPAGSRRTLGVNDVLGANKDFSTVVDSNTAVVVERPIYFNYRNVWTGGTVAVGAHNPKNAWYLAEGTTRSGFNEWLTLENPGPLTANVTIDYMPKDGPVMTQNIGIPGNTRVTVDVALFVGQGKDVSASIWSDRGIIVERPMYFNYNGVWTGGHDVIGL